MPSNHLILPRPLLLLPSIFPSIKVFTNESVLRIRWPKYWRFSSSISPSNEYSGLISFRIDWLDLLPVQGTHCLLSKQWKQWETLFFLGGGSIITEDDDCSREIKRRLLFGRKAMTKPDSIIKSRDITLPTKVHLVKAMGFPVVTYECKNWTIKKAEYWKIDAFELWC